MPREDGRVPVCSRRSKRPPWVVLPPPSASMSPKLVADAALCASESAPSNGSRLSPSAIVMDRLRSRLSSMRRSKSAIEAAAACRARPSICTVSSCALLYGEMRVMRPLSGDASPPAARAARSSCSFLSASARRRASINRLMPAPRSQSHRRQRGTTAEARNSRRATWLSPHGAATVAGSMVGAGVLLPSTPL